MNGYGQVGGYRARRADGPRARPAAGHAPQRHGGAAACGGLTWAESLAYVALMCFICGILPAIALSLLEAAGL